MSTRTNDIIKCEICGKETRTNGLANHFKHTHNLTIEDYVSKYGEYRPKYKKYKERSKVSNVKCEICDTKLASERRLSYHLREVHNISKREYVIQYLLDGEIPLCKCGCGEQVSIKERGSPPYWTEYISGHNTTITHVGMQRSYESRMKMRKSAIKRLERENSVFYRSRSNDEIDLETFLKSIYDGVIKPNDTELLSGKELDFYIPELDIAIELNGDRFHSDLYKDKHYHIEKTNECNKLGVRLIHIWLNDWIKKNDIIKSQLRYIFGSTPVKIYGRDCEIRDVSFKEASKFINDNHLQGYASSSIRYGLYYKNELVQIMTFGKLRKVVNMKSRDGAYELIRLCGKIDTVVIGGASKLFNHFIRENNPEYILSYANKDWAIGGVYEKLGMDYVGDTSVGYFYSNGKRRESRYACQKHKLVELGYDSSKTEYEIMSDRGYYRIWDTGNMKYEWIN